MGNNPSIHKGCDNCPVENVSWDDVQKFIKKLNKKTNKNFRLPTEAEWEYAARGGSQTHGYIFSGSNDLNVVAWYKSNSKDSTHPVGKKQSNELGLFDMSGNVYEWCSDWNGGDYYSKSPDTNPKGPKKDMYKVIRGGSFIDFIPLTESEYCCHVSARQGEYRDDSEFYIGFRLVISF